MTLMEDGYVTVTFLGGTLASCFVLLALILDFCFVFFFFPRAWT